MTAVYRVVIRSARYLPYSDDTAENWVYCRIWTTRSPNSRSTGNDSGLLLRSSAVGNATADSLILCGHTASDDEEDESTMDDIVSEAGDRGAGTYPPSYMLCMGEVSISFEHVKPVDQWFKTIR